MKRAQFHIVEFLNETDVPLPVKHVLHSSHYLLSTTNSYYKRKREQNEYQEARTQTGNPKKLDGYDTNAFLHNNKWLYYSCGVPDYFCLSDAQMTTVASVN